jgi:hypothetical protein
VKRVVHIGGMPYKRWNELSSKRDYVRELPSGAMVRVRWLGGRYQWSAHYYSRLQDFRDDRDCFVATATRSAGLAVLALRTGMRERACEI